MKNHNNPTPRGFRDLLVWQKGMDLAARIYGLSGDFPPQEKFGLTSQMRRSAVSIPSNIAEGQARHTKGEFIHFISYAEGSVAELSTQLELSVRLAFLDSKRVAPCFELLDDLRRMLNGLRRRLSETCHTSHVTRHTARPCS